MNTTQLQPITADRAKELDQMLRAVQGRADKGLGIDARGKITGIVDMDDPLADSVLGDFDVHA